VNAENTYDRQFTAQSALLIGYQKAATRYARALFNLADKIGALSPRSADEFPSMDRSRGPVSESTANPTDRHAA
jgi:hypothetical protein